MSSYPTRNIKLKKKIAKKIKKLKTNILATFQAKISWEWPRKRENKKKKSFRGVPTRPVIGNSKKIENIIMASFRGKICWGRSRKRENKLGKAE